MNDLILRSAILLSLVHAAAIEGLAPAWQAPASSSMRLASVQVKGANRYTPADVTKLSGLVIGNPATIADLTAAADRLGATGLFDSVKYSYTTSPRQITVTFEIEEIAWTVPVILDNFVWMTDEQMVAAVSEEVPSFNGMTAPANETAVAFLVRAMQKVLSARGLPGRVEFTPQVDMKTRRQAHVFSVKDPSPKVCALNVSGASALTERDLVEPLRTVIGGDYCSLSRRARSSAWGPCSLPGSKRPTPTT